MFQNQGRMTNWAHPAYANRHIIIRDDEEIVSYSLAADEQGQQRASGLPHSVIRAVSTQRSRM
jgi:hypothetical protein